MNNYQREIEKLLQASERNVSKELYQMYKSLADDISKEIVELQKEIDETDKFPKKLQKERLEAIRDQMDRKIRIVEQDQKSSIWSFYVITVIRHITHYSMSSKCQKRSRLPLVC